MRIDKARLNRVILVGVSLISIGLLYGYVLIPKGFFIPCLFAVITGKRCPGCGITSMCVAFLHGNIFEGAKNNLGLFFALPFILLSIMIGIWKYVQDKPAGKENALYVILAIYLMLWGMVRNFIGL